MRIKRETREAWALIGFDLIHGEVSITTEPVVSFEADNGSFLMVPAEAMAFTAEQVRERLTRAADHLRRTLERFNREFERNNAPLIKPTPRGEKYAGIDI